MADKTIPPASDAHAGGWRAGGRGADAAARREDRLAAALRENLRRRKSQERDRQGGSMGHGDGAHEDGTSEGGK